MERSLKKWFPLFVMPLLIAFVIAFLVPFLLGIGLSFTEFTTVSDARFVGFENYVAAFGEGSNFLPALGFTVGVTAVSVVLVNVIAFALALLLTRGMKGTNFFRTVYFTPNLIGGIVLGYIWQLIFNGVLGRFGMDITYKQAFGFWGIVILTCWQLIGYMMIIYVAGLQNVPPELTEAAQIDGAGRFRMLRHITIPMVSSAITICTFLTLTNVFKMFDQNYALTGGAPGKSTSMLALDIFRTFYGSVGSEGVGQAKAVIFFLILALIAALQQWLAGRKERGAI